MRLLVTFYLTAVVCLTALSEASKCDQNIINMIKEQFWNHGYCIPTGLLRTGAFMSPEVIKITTEGYYPDEENVSCIYSNFEGSVVKVYIQYENSTSGEPTTVTNDLEVVEKDGVLIEQAKGIYRYHLYSLYGVTVFYKCSETGESGKPEALIKVSARKYDQAALDQAVTDLASLGINVRHHVFGDSCVPSPQ